MSASAPLGRPSRKTGMVAADCTSATQIGEVVMDVIIQAAATSFIHMQMLATSQVVQSMRNTGRWNGAQAESDSPAGRTGGALALTISSGIRSVLRVRLRARAPAGRFARARTARRHRRAA